MASVRDSVVELFASVGEALARATWALLHGDVHLAEAVIEGDRAFDERAASLEAQAWAELDAGQSDPAALRELVSVLLICSELERSADLAEHIAQRARASLGNLMTPTSRGIVQRMSEAALELWEEATAAWDTRTGQDPHLEEGDEELDILHRRLTAEVAAGTMDPSAAAQVTLLGRFYERLGDHAVNLGRRAAALRPDRPPPP